MNTLQNKVLAAEENLRHALLRGDSVTLEWLLADDVVFVTPDGKLLDKAADLQTHRSGDLKIHGYDPVGDPLVQRTSEDAFLLSTVIDLDATFKGERHAGTFRYTRLYVRRPGGWRIAFAQAAPTHVE